MNNDILRQVQLCCLEIFKDIDKICRENKIEYSLCGGSVIGAMLYEGFIPWDDDIDLMMDRNNYEKFLEIYPKLCKKNYKVVNFNTIEASKVPALFSRVVDLNTEIVENLGNQIEKIGNVFVDVTVFDNISSKINYKLKDIYRHYIYSYYYKKNNLVPGTKWKKIIYSLLKNNIREDKLKKMYVKYDLHMKRNKDKKTKYITEMLGTIFPGKLYTKNIFADYENIKFEDMNARIVKDYKEYLYQRYGRREFTKDNKSGVHSHILSFKRK